MNKVTLIIGKSGKYIGIVEDDKLEKACASLEEGTVDNYTCVSFQLNKLTYPQKVYVGTKAESLGELSPITKMEA